MMSWLGGAIPCRCPVALAHVNRGNESDSDRQLKLRNSSAVSSISYSFFRIQPGVVTPQSMRRVGSHFIAKMCSVQVCIVSLCVAMVARGEDSPSVHRVG